MCLQYCSVEGCELTITDGDRKNWERARERGLEGFEGLCLAHMKDKVKRAELARIKAASAQPSNRPAYGNFECEDGWIRAGAAAKILRIGVASINGLAELSLLEVKVYGHHSRRAVEANSLLNLVASIEDGTTPREGVPDQVFNTIVLHLPEIKAELEEICQNGAKE